MFKFPRALGVCAKMNFLTDFWCHESVIEMWIRDGYEYDSQKRKNILFRMEIANQIWRKFNAQ